MQARDQKTVTVEEQEKVPTAVRRSEPPLGLELAATAAPRSVTATALPSDEGREQSLAQTSALPSVQARARASVRPSVEAQAPGSAQWKASTSVQARERTSVTVVDPPKVHSWAVETVRS